MAASTANAVVAPVDPSWAPTPRPGPGLRIEHVRPDGAVLLSTADRNGTFDPNDDVRRLTQVGVDGRPDKRFSRDGAFGLEGRQNVLFRDGEEFVTWRRVYTKELGWRSNVELRRVRADGTFDPNWGTGGVSELWLIAPWDVKPDDGGRNDESCAGWPTPTGSALLVLDQGRRFNILHLTERGVPDPAIGSGGWVEVRLPAGIEYNGIGCRGAFALAGDLVLVMFEAPDARDTIRAALVNERTGAFDPAWGSGGLSNVSWRPNEDDYSAVRPHVQLADGRVVAIETHMDITKTQAPNGVFGIGGVTRYGLALLRSADGSFVRGFGGDGHAEVAASQVDAPYGIQLPLVAMHQGKVVVVVQRDGARPSSVYRYLLDGTPDPEFGVGGRVDLGHRRPFVAALDPVGRLILHGHSEEHEEFVRFRTDAADLSVALIRRPASDGRFVAQVTVRSLGPLAARRVVVTTQVPADASGVRGSLRGGTCATRTRGGRQLVTCVISRMLVTDHVTIRISGTASTGTAVLRANVNTRTPDHRANNDADV